MLLTLQLFVFGRWFDALAAACLVLAVMFLWSICHYRRLSCFVLMIGCLILATFDHILAQQFHKSVWEIIVLLVAESLYVLFLLRFWMFIRTLAGREASVGFKAVTGGDDDEKHIS